MAVEENCLSVCRWRQITVKVRQARDRERSVCGLTTGPGGEVLERGPFHAEVSVSYDKHFVQNSSVVDEALEHAGRMNVSQTPCAEDQRHLQRHFTAGW